MTNFTKYLLNYAGLNAPCPEEVSNWITTVAEAYAVKNNAVENKLTDYEHVIDYLLSDKAPKRLKRMSVAQARANADKWSKANQKRGRNIEETDEDTKLVHDFLDGTKIVKLLSEKAYKREGFLMSHCVGGYSPSTSTIYSYRDKKNEPHATFEVNTEDGIITQIKGKGNGAIHPKYIHPILAFLKTVGMEVRPQDMINLGYYHVPADYRQVMDQFVDSKGNPPSYTVINGESYIFKENGT